MRQPSLPPNPVPGCKHRSTRSWRESAVWMTALAVAYFGLAKLGLMIPTVGNSVTLLWPPTGLAVYALFCWGRRYWPSVAIGALAVNLTLAPAWVAAGITIGNTLAPLAAVELLRRNRFHPSFDTRRDVFGFILLGAVAPMAISAANGATWLLLHGAIEWGQFFRTVCIWWAGDAAGVFVFSPVLFGLPGQIVRWRREGMPLGAAVWLLVITGLSVVVFTGLLPTGASGWAISYLPILILAWANLGYRGSVASLGVVITCGFAVFGTAVDVGPFSHPSDDTEVFQVFVYMLSVSLITLVISGVLGERDGIERALSTREAEYRAMVEDNPALIARFTLAGMLVYANDTYCKFKGTTREYLYGRLVYELIVGSSKSAVRDLLKQFKPGMGEVLTFHGPFVDHTGAERWIEWKGQVLGDEIQVVGLDVSERRNSELDRQKLESRMVQAQKMESLGAIAGGVAHDFNNLLTGVLGHTDLAITLQPPNGPARKHLEAVIESAGRATDLSRQLLAYAGKGQLLIRPVDLNAATTRAVELGGKLIPGHVTVSIRPVPNLACVDGDESQIQQMVLNLFRNAIEAIGQHPGTIELTTGSTDVREQDLLDPGTGMSLPSGRYVWVRVQDTGHGISSELLPKIYDPFVTSKFTGRGLGLAAVQGIVRAHGGAIRVDTSPTGTTFTVLFPASATTAKPIDRNKTTLVTKLDTDRRRLALVVDDEDGVRELTAHMVRQLGWEVLTAENGAAGVKLFAANKDRVRFVVMDLTMPEMDGWQAMAAMRRLRPDLPILLSTGHNEESIPNSDPTTTAILLKPFRVNDLERAITRLLSGPRPQAMAGVHS